MRYKRHLLAMMVAFLAVAIIGVLVVFRSAESAVVYGIPVGDFPQYTTAVGSKIYTSNRNAGTVSVLDTATNSVIATIPVGTTPVESILVGTDLYVSNSGAGTVSVIDTTTDTVTDTITVGSGAWTSSLVGTELYVNNNSANTISVIDTVTKTVTDTITVGNGIKDSVLVGTKFYLAQFNQNNVLVIDTLTKTVSATIPVGTAPTSIITNGTSVYTLNQNSNSVSVIDSATDSVVSTIPTATQPVDALFVGTDLYIAHFNAARVSVIDTLSNTVTNTIVVGTTPGKLATVGTNVYALNRTTDNVSVIDTVTKTVTATVAAGDLPIDAELIGSYLYMANGIGDNVYVLDTNTNLLVDIGLPTIVSAVVSGNILTLQYDEALDSGSTPDTTDFQVMVNFAPTNVTLVSVAGSQVVLTLASVPGVFDTVSVSYTVPVSDPIQDTTGNNAAPLTNYPVTVRDCGSIAVGSTPITGIEVGTSFYVYNYGSANASVIDVPTGIVVDTIPIGSGARDGVLVGTKLYIVNSFSDSISVVETTTNNVVATISVGSFPVAIKLVGTDLYVSNQLGNSISVISSVTDSVTATIALSDGPSFMKLIGTTLYAIGVTPGVVYAIDTTTNTVAATMTVGPGAQSLESVGTQLYVANSFADTVSVIDTNTNTVTDTVVVGSSPNIAAVLGTRIYVSNRASNDVSVIDTLTNTVVATTTVGPNPIAGAVYGTDLYVIMQGGARIDVIDTLTDSVTNLVTGLGSPNDLKLVGTSFYVMDLGGRVRIVDTATKALATCAVSLMHTLTYTAGANGSITGSSPQVVADGANGSAVTAVPNPGYTFTQWSDASTANPRTDTNVLGDISVTASFTAIPVSSGGGGGGGCVGQECGDTLGPVISDILVSERTTSTALITWKTSEPATTAMYFGLNDGYGSGYRGSYDRVMSHSILLTNLSAGQEYHFQLQGTDTRGNTTVSGDQDFKTLTTEQLMQSLIISDVEAILVTDSTAVITWKTNAPLNSRVDFGTSSTYGNIATNSPLTMSHLVNLSGLLSNTTYHYQVSSGYGTSVTSSVDLVFNTLVRVVPPANPLDFSATGEKAQIRLSWQNPTEADFSRVKILARADRYPTDPTDGVVIYEGEAERAIHQRLEPLQTYFYTIFAYDELSRYSSGALAMATTLAEVPVPEPVPTPTSTTPVIVPPVTTSTGSTKPPVRPAATTTTSTTMPVVVTTTASTTMPAPVIPEPEVVPPREIEPPVSPVIQVPVTQVLPDEPNPLIHEQVIHEIEKSSISPVSVGLVATAATVASIATLANLFSYLGYLLSQPLMLIGARLRKKWGVVYNSITKQGTSLAVVRLIDATTGRVLQTRITDEHGRYFFHVKPGQYRIEATKAEHVFPSVIASGLAEDDEYLDIYHGTPITVDTETDLMMNIPIDPNHRDEQNGTVLFKRLKTKVQYAISALSFSITAVAFILQPGPALLSLLLLQVATYLLFRKLVAAHKPKNWGVVSEAGTNKPMKDVVVRIFDRQYNKLLETQVTDGKGRYGFLAGKNRYFVTADKLGYERFTSPDIDLTQVEEQTIERPITLKKIVEAAK